MFYRFCTLVLMAGFLFQAMAVASTLGVSQQGAGLEHLLVHSQDANHHHHVDNALHMDDDGGSVQHQHADSSSSTSAILVALNSVVLDINAMSMPYTKATLWLSATLEGPLRPPKPRA